MRPRLIGIVTVTIIALWFGSGDGRSEKMRHIEAAYDVTVAGLTVMKVRYGTTISGSAFRTTTSIKSTGLSALFSDYNMDAESSGVAVGNVIRPTFYASDRRKGKKERLLSLSWSDEGAITQGQSVSKRTEVQRGVEVALTTETFDPLSAILRIGTVQTGTPCRAARRVFDGRNVFDLRFSLESETIIKAKQVKAYRGPVHLCRMVWKPIAGRSASDEPATYDIWMAPVGGKMAGGRLWLPIMIKGSLKGFGFAAYATLLTINGEAMAGHASD